MKDLVIIFSLCAVAAAMMTTAYGIALLINRLPEWVTLVVAALGVLLFVSALVAVHQRP